MSRYVTAAAGRIAGGTAAPADLPLPDLGRGVLRPKAPSARAAPYEAKAPATSGYGGRTEKRAAELGLDLSAECVDALKNIPLSESLNLLDETSTKLSSIRDVSGYIAAAAYRIASADGDTRTTSAPSGKGGKGGKPDTRTTAATSGNGGKGGKPDTRTTAATSGYGGKP